MTACLHLDPTAFDMLQLKPHCNADKQQTMGTQRFDCKQFLPSRSAHKSPAKLSAKTALHDWGQLALTGCQVGKEAPQQTLMVTGSSDAHGADVM